MLQIKDVY